MTLYTSMVGFKTDYLFLNRYIKGILIKLSLKLKKSRIW